MMRRHQQFVVLTALISCCTTQGRCDVIWDNGDYLDESALTSERETLVPESWTVDDFVSAGPVIVREFRWTSLMTADLDPVASDLVVLTPGFDVVLELRDLPFSREWVGKSFGLDVYEVTIGSLEIELDPGRYYIGGRMVGTGGGRAYAALRGEIRGLTQAYLQSEYFGFPDWSPVSDVEGREYDAVFTVYGDVVPAPWTAPVLALGAVALFRRRRVPGPDRAS